MNKNIETQGTIHSLQPGYLPGIPLPWVFWWGGPGDWEVWGRNGENAATPRYRFACPPSHSVKPSSHRNSSTGSWLRPCWQGFGGFGGGCRGRGPPALCGLPCGLQGNSRGQWTYCFVGHGERTRVVGWLIWERTIKAYWYWYKVNELQLKLLHNLPCQLRTSPTSAKTPGEQKDTVVVSSAETPPAGQEENTTWMLVRHNLLHIHLNVNGLVIENWE